MVYKVSSHNTSNLWREYHGAIGRGELPVALSTAERAVSLYKASGDFRQAGIWQRALSNVLFLQGRYKEAVAEGKCALKLHIDNYEKALSLVEVANVQTYTGKYKSAFTYFNQALSAAREYPDDVYLWTHFYGSRAHAYNKTGQFDKAIIDWEGAADIFRASGHLWRAAAYLNNIGYILLTAGHCKEAEQRVLEALELIEEDPHLHTEGVIYDSLGYAYTLLGQHIDAERFLRKSARILESLDDKPQLVGTLLHLSELYQSLRRYETARLEAARALALATEIDSEPLRIEARDRLKGVMLGQLHEGLGNRLKAYRRFRYRIYGIERSEGQGGPWTKG